MRPNPLSVVGGDPDGDHVCDGHVRACMWLVGYAWDRIPEYITLVFLLMFVTHVHTTNTPWRPTLSAHPAGRVRSTLPRTTVYIRYILRSRVVTIGAHHHSIVHTVAPQPHTVRDLAGGPRAREPWGVGTRHYWPI
jgi:hypothetical protein